MFFQLHKNIPTRRRNLASTTTLTNRLRRPPIIRSTISSHYNRFIIHRSHTPFARLSIHNRCSTPSFMTTHSSLMRRTHPISIRKCMTRLIRCSRINATSIPRRHLRHTITFNLTRLRSRLNNLVRPRTRPRISHLRTRPSHRVYLSTPNLTMRRRILHTQSRARP